ncbi:MAG: FAD-dependent monooxygenase, partial [Gaiellales bacterium]
MVTSPIASARPVVSAAAPPAPPPVDAGARADGRVVIIGAGPAGMATAIELAQHNIPSIVLEKRTGA